MAMKTLTAIYPSPDGARNAFDDLINAGFAREKIHLDHDAGLVKVITPGDVESEARELLDRHDPTEVTEAPL